MIAPKVNAAEVDLVAQLVLALRAQLLDDDGAAYAGDLEFFQRGTFVVSPHHDQIRAIRSELATRREWRAPPFVDTVDKMQGQEAEAVIVSYGVSDPEHAMREAAFIYGLNRLNVAMTRARTKCVVMLPAELLNPPPEVFDDPSVAEGVGFMQRLVASLERNGETHSWDLGAGRSIRTLRIDRAP